MSAPIVRALAASISGALFGVGLIVSGMTDPRKVLGFLDVGGGWDGSLLFVMAGAIGVHALAYRWIRKRPSPLLAVSFQVPTRRDLDAKLLLGAAVFGVGWGLSGLCPGPSLVNVTGLSLGSIAFVAAMVAGTLLAMALEKPRLSSSTASETPALLAPARD